MSGGGGEFAFAVAAAGGLGDGVKSGDAAKDDGEIDVHAGFDELGRDDAHGEAGAETRFDRVEDAGAVLSTHEGAEVKMGVVARKAFEEGASVTAGADDAEDLGVGEEQRDEGVVVETAKRGSAHASEGGVEAGAVGDDLGGGDKADFEVGTPFERGLGGGAEHDAGAVVGGEFLDGAQAGREEFEWERLGLVEDDDRAGDAVEFATARGAVGVERLEELDVGGDDQAGVPVFGG